MQVLSSLSGGSPLLLLIAVTMLAGVASDWLAQQWHIPDVVLFLLAGLLLNPVLVDAAGLPDYPGLMQAVLVFGASYILFEGGMGVRLAVLKQIWLTVTLIATLGVLVTAAVTCAAAHWFLRMDWPLAFLLGVIMAATDPAALIPMFRQIGIREKLAQTVICEAAFNDAVSAVLTFALLGLVYAGGGFSVGGVAADFLVQAGIGIGAGAAIGLGVAFLVGHQRYGFLRDHLPLLTVAAVAAAYLDADRFGGSGFMAVFVAGIVVGNRGSFGLDAVPADTRRMHEFAGSTTLLLRMIVFIALGARMDLHSIGGSLGAVAGILAVFVLVARPLTVLSCALPDRRARWSGRELLFM